jgi:transposase-like protein
MLKNNQVIRRFSESVKLKVLSELSEGKYTKQELCRMYNVHPSTVTDWIHKYKRKDLLNQRVTIESMDELSRIHQLQKELEQLKNLLVQKDLDAMVLNFYLKVASNNLGYADVEELKKKLNTKPSSKP